MVCVTGRAALNSPRYPWERVIKGVTGFIGRLIRAEAPRQVGNGGSHPGIHFSPLGGDVCSCDERWMWALGLRLWREQRHE